MRDKINLILVSTQAKTKILLTKVLPLIILFIMLWHQSNEMLTFSLVLSLLSSL